MSLEGILVRLEVIWHKICHPHHTIIWRHNPVLDDPDFKCEGDIVCHTCNQLYWCRFYDHPDRFKTDKINEIKHDYDDFGKDKK